MINNLTGLRFYMAFWVVLYHVREALDIPVITNVISYGYMGVDVFFVLSGYILTYVYYEPFFTRPTTTGEKFEFIKKRFARIYPLHLATLIAAVGFMLVLNALSGLGARLYWNHVVPQLFMVHAWGIVDGIRWNFPSWSISAEWFAYLLVFPLCHWLFRKAGIAFSIITTLLVFAVYMMITNQFFDNNIGVQHDTGIVRIIPEFLLGSATFLLFRNSNTSTRALFAGGCVALGLIAVFKWENMQYVYILLVPLVLVVLHKGNIVLDFIFGNKVVVFLGEVSYSIYMLHFFSRAINGIIHKHFFGSELNSPFYFINYTVLTIGVSVLAYYLIEMPGRRFVNNLKMGKS